MTKVELANFKKNLYEDYFEKRILARDLCGKYNQKYGTIMYHISQAGYTQAEFLQAKYSKEFLTSELENCTIEELSGKLKLGFHTLRNLVSSYGIKTSVFRKKNLITNSLFYSHEDFSKEFYYFAGLFVTDGYFHKNHLRITIKNKGAETLFQKISKVMGYSNVKSYKNEYFEMDILDSGLKEKLISIGIPEKAKTYTLRDVFIPDADCLYCFLLGCLDGDGWISSQKSPYGYKTSLGFNLCNFNKEFLLNLQIKIKNLINHESSLYTGKQNIPALKIGIKQGSIDLFSKMYSISPFYLECKHNTYLNIINKVMI